MNDFVAVYSRVSRYAADHSDIASFLHQLGSHPDHRVPNSNLRMVAADAFDEHGRHREADVLRNHPGDAHVFRDHVTRFDPYDVRRAVHGYQQAALWSTPHEDPDSNDGQPLHGGLDHDFNTGDIAPKTHAEMSKHVLDFLEDNHHLLPAEPDFEDVGHYFWMSRNGHGVGFSDHPDRYEHADELQDAARKRGEYYLDAGSDGQVHGYGN